VKRAKVVANVSLAVMVVGVVGVLGCKPAAQPPHPDMGKPAPNPTGSGAMASQDLDPHGGKVALEKVTLAVPPGVLAGAQTIVVQSSKTPAPPSLAAATPVYSFAPDGTTFQLPLTVTFDYDGKTPNPVIYWSKPGSASEFEALPTIVQGNKLYAAVTHFSSGFVASAASSADQMQLSQSLVTIHGTQTTTFVSANSTTAPLGTDFTTSPIVASYWDGSAFQPLTVTYGATGSGVFTVGNVPPGVYYLQYTASGEKKPSFVVADTQSNGTIDLSIYRIGRPDATTLVAKDVYTLDPVVAVGVTTPTGVAWPAWTTAGASNIGDTFEIYSPNSGAYIYGSNDGPNDPPPDTNNQFLFHWSDMAQPIVDLQLPTDAPIFFRMTQSAQEPLAQVISHISQPVTMPLQIPALDSSNKAVALTNVPITVSPVSGAQNYNLSFAASKCPAPSAISPKPLVAGTNPSASVDIDTQPGNVNRGQLAGTPDLVIFGSAASATSLADLSLSNIAVGNPFPSTWELIALGGCSYQFQYGAVKLPPFGVSVAAGVSGTNVALAPLVSSPQAPKLDGKDWNADQTLASLTPLLTWSPPAMGTPLAYNISVYQLNASYIAKAASIRTSANSFVLPAGILTSGASYFIQITATASGGSSANQFVNALQLPKTTSPVLSGILTAP
jgi:hypothetical protein